MVLVFIALRSAVKRFAVCPCRILIPTHGLQLAIGGHCCNQVSIDFTKELAYRLVVLPILLKGMERTVLCCLSVVDFCCRHQFVPTLASQYHVFRGHGIGITKLSMGSHSRIVSHIRCDDFLRVCIIIGTEIGKVPGVVVTGYLVVRVLV